MDRGKPVALTANSGSADDQAGGVWRHRAGFEDIVMDSQVGVGPEVAQAGGVRQA